MGSDSRRKLDYRVLQAELKLAKSNQPYLVLDFKRNQLEIKAAGNDGLELSADIGANG